MYTLRCWEYSRLISVLRELTVGERLWKPWNNTWCVRSNCRMPRQQIEPTVNMIEQMPPWGACEGTEVWILRVFISAGLWNIGKSVQAVILDSSCLTIDCEGKKNCEKNKNTLTNTWETWAICYIEDKDPKERRRWKIQETWERIISPQN